MNKDLKQGSSVKSDISPADGKQLVSFSIFDKVYMDSPFGRYTGIVKGVDENKVTIESYSPMGRGMMLADYDIKGTDWQKY